ncbi:MAG: phage baseplate assembly protein V [Ferruginibacter sp.]
MEYLVTAEIEIDGNKIEHYTNITLRQKFNEHHHFTIRISHDVLESSGSFSLENAQKKIGKSALIRLKKRGLSLEDAFEFRGIVCEVRMEQTGKSDADLVLIGYSPTILLENGQHLASFYKCDLKKIVQQVTKPLGQVNCAVNIKNQYSKPITYICQYKESGFHFLNRLSADFSEFFYYDGKDLNFGKPSSNKTVDITYGEDISSMQMTLQAQPANFSNYSYISKEDKVEKYDAPSNVNGMGQYASYVLKESNNLFAEPVNLPVKQRIENKSDLENFVKKQKASIAASMEVLTGTSYNPQVSLGNIINVKVSRLQELSFVKEDYGKFLVIGIEHHLNESGKYYNTFEAIPSSIEVLPIPQIIAPLAEPQIAIVKDNKDPDNMGRVRVQMLWQKGNEMTEWIRVMTPDAGSGKGGGRNRGLVVIPEPDDQVLICFRYNDPDRPFVMGSLFHGKSGGGGGQSNNTKSLNSKSGHTITLDDGAGITIVDKSGKNLIVIDGTNAINVTADLKIELSNGKSSIVMDGDTISISAAHININGTDDAAMFSGSASFDTKKDGAATMAGKNVTVSGTADATVTSPKTTLNGDASTSVKSSGPTSIEGAIVKLN